jgi:phage terminase large subunit
MQTINLQDPALYANTFWKVSEAFYGPNRFNIIWGSSNSSKSYSMYQRFIQEFLQEQKRDYLVLRKHGTTLFDSVFSGMRNIITEWGLKFMFTFKESPGNLTITNKYTGRRIVFKGLDDSEKIKSVVNFKYCLLEEATEFHLSDWLEINRRLRGFEGIKFFFIFNPIDRNHWINKHFFLTPSVREKCMIIHCTYHDNKFATKEDIEQLEGLKDIDENDWRIYCLGEWGVLTSRLIFNNWSTVVSVPPEARQIPSGMDFGYSPDPATLTDLYIRGDELYIDERIYKTGLTNINTGNEFEQSMQQELERIGFDKQHLIIADSAEPKSIRELRDVGFNIYAVKKPGISESIKMMKSYRLFITEHSTNAINEFENYQRKVDRYGTILPEPLDAFNHIIDPVRYVLTMKGKLWV